MERDLEQSLCECIAQLCDDPVKANVAFEAKLAFADAVNHFVGGLLSEVGYSGRPTDGVFFDRLALEPGCATGAGLVVMIDGQAVEPLAVELLIDAYDGKIVRGFVRFGNRDAAAPKWGSSGHRRLQEKILTDRTVEFRWRHQFVCDAGGWRHEAPSE